MIMIVENSYTSRMANLSDSMINFTGIWAPFDLGGMTLMPEENYTSPESVSVIQMHSKCIKN